MQEINIFSELFLSTEMWGYFGPLGLIVIGYFLAKKQKTIGVIWFLVECLCAAQYFDLLEATPEYWWQIIILLLGGALVLVPQLMDR